MNDLDHFKKRENKKEVELRRKREKETEEKELQKVRKEVFRATGSIYIEPFASRSPLAFCENSENSKGSKDKGEEILERLRRYATIKKGLEETQRDL